MAARMESPSGDAGQQTDVAALWDQALTSYSDRTGVDIRMAVQPQKSISSIMMEQQRLLQAFSGFRHNKGKVDKLRTVIARNADVVQSVATLVADAASAAFSPSAIILTAFTNVLNASKHVSDDYNAILGFFDLMNSFLERLSLLEGKLPRLPAFRKFVVQVFSSMLCVSGIARSYCLKGRFVKWAKALVDGTDEELQAALDNLKENLRRLESAMLMHTLRTAMETHDEVKAAKDGVSTLTGHVRELQSSMDKNTALTEQTLMFGERAMNAALETGIGVKDLLVNSHESAIVGQTLLRQQAKIHLSLEKMQGGRKLWTLRPSAATKTANLEQLRAYLLNQGEGAMRARLDEFELINPRMFQWVENEPLFEDIVEERSRWLWLSGKPGMGKSTISFKLFQLLRERLLEEQNAYVAAYFFDETLKRHTSDRSEAWELSKMLQWVGIKVAEQDSHYRDELLTALRRGGRPSDYNYYWIHIIRERFPKGSSRRLVVILDGFDLLSRDERVHLVNLLQSAKSNEMRVQFILTGDPKVETELGGLCDSGITLTKEKLARDFRKLADFRSKELPRLRGLRVRFRKLMVKKVAHMADSFFYVEHSMRRLNSLRREALISNELERLPESITQLYETLANECKRNRTPGEIEVLRGLFAWLAYANSEVTIAEASKIITIVAQENLISIEEELDGRLSRLLRISRSQDGDTQAQDSDVSDSDNSDSKADEQHRVAEDHGADSILGFQERSLRAFFRQAAENDQGLKCSPSDAHAIILRICIAALRTSNDQKLYSDSLTTYAAANWGRHFVAIDTEGIGDAQAAEVLESIHSLLNNKNNALRVVELGITTPKCTVLDAADLASAGESSGVLNCLQGWARRALKLPPGILSYGLADWYRPLAAEPARVFITLARSHINNWFSAQWIIQAYASFRVAQSTLRAGSRLPELRQNPGLREYFEKHRESDEPTTIESFDVVANAFWDIVKTAASHRGIARAMKHVHMFEPAIARLDLSLSLVEEGADKEIERYDALSSKGDAFIRLAQTLGDSDPGRSKELMAQAAGTLAEAIGILDLQTWLGPGVARDGDGAFAWGWIVRGMHAVACAGIGDFAASLASIKRSAAEGTFGVLPGFLSRIIKAMVDGNELSLMLDLLRSVGDRDRLSLFETLSVHSPMLRAAHERGESGAILELLDSASQYAAREKLYRSRARLLEITAQFAWSVMGREEEAKKRLRTLLDEDQIPSYYMNEAADLLAQLLYEQFRQSPLPNTKNSALEELRRIRRKLENEVSDFDPARSYTVVPLALMLRRLGPALDYAAVLQAAFNACIEGLKDDTGANDFQSLFLLKRVLMCVDGLERDAQIAYSAQQYILDDDIFRREKAGSKSSSGSGEEGAESAGGQRPEEVAEPGGSSPPRGEQKDKEGDKEAGQEPKPEQNGEDRKIESETSTATSSESGGTTTPATLKDEIREGLLPTSVQPNDICDMCFKPVWVWEEGASYSCLQCTRIDICATCMADRLASERGEKDLFWRVVCPQGHRYIKGPVEGWRGIRNGVMRIGDEELPVKQWVADVEKRWALYWDRYWSETMGA
ncbi:hypothetical protein MAPG_03544 [Magnaporthiopsis poae ATCC 64411]|uniref:Uncharacterized protein n=1 Tax=Magnaporthiopsis poae (strain ATCC 64411 / 73-15) TaxID=644358 RepID=A0A0C4DUA7_MAGP6|nr:hypothetical protein MAPG_03544 [Magnaporthiopsis poae ATCC 64411]